MKLKCKNCDCTEKAYKSLFDIIQELPETRRILITDIKAAKEGDPAASSLDEIVFSYPF